MITISAAFLDGAGTYATGQTWEWWPDQPVHFLQVGGVWIEQTYGAQSLSLTHDPTHDVIALPDTTAVSPADLGYFLRAPDRTRWHVRPIPADNGTGTDLYTLQEAGRATIIPANAPLSIEMAVGPRGSDGPAGAGTPGAPGAPGSPGSPGVGVPLGGTTGQVLTKASNADFDTDWVTESGGSSGIAGATGTAPLVLSYDSGTEELTGSVDAATTSGRGAVQLATPSSDTTAGHVVQASDARLSDSRTPAGAAGGDLTGTYPDPTIGSVGASALPAATTSAQGAVVLATPSSDVTAGHVIQGTDARLSDTRTPTDGSVTTAKLAAGAVTDAKVTDVAYSKLTSVPSTFAPSAHETTHIANGSDALPWTTVHGKGLDSGKPVAGSTNAGYLYFSTDINGGTLYRSTGSAWDQVGLGLSSGGGGGAGDTAWTAASHQNSWVSFGSGFASPGYLLDGAGVVHLRGVCAGGAKTGGTLIFTLPVGYRPSAKILCAVYTSDTQICQLQVGTDGTVTQETSMATNSFMSFDGISFSTI